MKKKLLIWLWVGVALLSFSGIKSAQAQAVDAFFDVGANNDPYLEVTTGEDWVEALYGCVMKAGTNEQWMDYMGEWELHGPPDAMYPANEFSPPKLYVYDGSTDIQDPGVDPPGLVMMWGEQDPLLKKSLSSNWLWDYTADPDLTNTTIQITVTAPPFINVVSFGMRDVNGNIRAWYWNVGLLATDPIQPNIPTTITINTALLGVTAATPQATAYMNNPAFDITQVLTFIFDENAIWVGGTPVPPPGQIDPRPWNYWQNLIVKPNPPLLHGLGVGINFKVHQGIRDLERLPNDFHLRGWIKSSGVPVLIRHIDGGFTDFDIVINPTTPSSDNWYSFTANWKTPILYPGYEPYIPYCTKMHLGLKFRVYCHNVIIKAYGWWTRDGVPVFNLTGAPPNLGNEPIIGFEVLDNLPTEVVEYDPAQPDPDNPTDERQRIRIQLGDPDEQAATVETEIVAMSLLSTQPLVLQEMLGEDMFGALNEDNQAEKELPYMEVFHADGTQIGEDAPIVLDDDPQTAVESFFDVFTELAVDLPDPDPFVVAEPFRIEPGDILITKLRIRFKDHLGEYVYRWVWHWHEAHRGLRELGDAPDSTNHFFTPMTAYNWGRRADFPTVYRIGPPWSAHGPIHWFPRRGAFLGRRVTLETEADIGFDQDGVNNIIPRLNQPNRDKADDGLRNMPLLLPHCTPTRFSYIVTVVRPGKYYTNVWFDYNRDGDWNDTLQCPTSPGGLTPAPEHAVPDQPLIFSAPGTYVITTPPFRPWNPYPNIWPWNVTAYIPRPIPLWMRITLSDRPWEGSSDPGVAAWAGGSGSRRGYLFGETEDYIFTPRKMCCMNCPDINGDGIINMIDFAWFAGLWLQNCPPNVIIQPPL